MTTEYSIPLNIRLQILRTSLNNIIAELKQYDDESADAATEGDITYIRLCLADTISAIGAIDPSKLENLKKPA